MKSNYLLCFILVLFQFACSSTKSYTGSKHTSPAKRTHVNKEYKKGDSKSTSAESALRQSIVDFADSYIGAKYKYGGRGPDNFDCSGFTCYVLNQFSMNIPATSSGQSTTGKRIKASQSQPGDLVFFGSNGKVGHVAIVTRNKGQELFVIHSTSSAGVRIDEIYGSSYWRSRLLWVVDTMETYRD